MPKPLAARDRGASSVEYGLLVVLIAAVIVTAVVGLGGVTGSLFTKSCEEYSSTSAALDSDCE